jgi:hypothetical protein
MQPTCARAFAHVSHKVDDGTVVANRRRRADEEKAYWRELLPEAVAAHEAAVSRSR